MSESSRCAIERAAAEITENYRMMSPIVPPAGGRRLPDRRVVVEMIGIARRLFFPGFFGDEQMEFVSESSFAGYTLGVLYEKLQHQICAALACRGCTDMSCEDLAARFVAALPAIQRAIFKDVEATLNGDPAAGSLEEIIFCYPGIYAIAVYRMAHELYTLGVPYIPRMMTEHAHSKTGIDINPGATIGSYFFIDHGTGIVIGETTVIGNNVKIYQGVTLGALSTMKGRGLVGVKRHPTIEDDVVIYANTTILGGETVIGHGSVIAGNAFITSSVAPNTKVARDAR